MALAHDWQVRIDGWIQAVNDRIIRPLKLLDVGFAATMEHLTVAQARRLAFKPARAGMKWGRKWQYGWFRCRATAPKVTRGKAAVLTPGLGPVESIVFAAGKTAGGIDGAHRHIDLTAMGLTGKSTEFLVEAYAGHGPTPCSLPFLLPGKPAIPEPPPAQQTFHHIALGEWNEQAYQLWMDAVTLRKLYDCLSDSALRRHRIAQALMDVTVVLDVEAEQELFEAAIPAARKVLAPLLAARNGDTAAEIYAFGHSHIDVAWRWPIAQTYRKSAHTFSTQLALMQRYKEFQFLQSQPQLYDYLKGQYPDVYRRIKQAARRGQWLPEGGMWVEPDTNATSGESLIRQFLYGKRMFKAEFGVDNEVCWLPDVFGFSAALPQIIRGCGMKYFSTQKIFWTQHGGTKWPCETFMWRGIDGSEVLTHLHRNYNANTDPPNLQRRWLDCLDKHQTQSFLYPFGWGDGGGGPSRDHLEYLRRCKDLEGLPRTRIASPNEFFAKLAKAGRPKDTYVGELYLELHRGTFTSQARTKQLNRLCEFALREAEMWSALAAAGGRKYPAAALEATWKKVLLNQFHDILPGSSIERVYVEAEELYEEALAEAQAINAKAKAALARRRGGWSVWNSLSWPREMLVEIPAATGQCAVTEDGTALEAQPVGRGAKRKLLVAIPDVPAIGSASIRLTAGKSAPVADGASARAIGAGAVMENALLRVRINRRGEIAELYDKTAGRGLVPAGEAMNRLELYRDNPSQWGAWDIDMAYKSTPVALGPAESIRVAAKGPLEARVSIRRRLGKSLLRQEIVLRRDQRQVEFRTHVDWRQSHRLLKVAFPADLAAVTLRGEIQFGHVIRPNHANTEFEQRRFEWPAQKWAAVSEADYGIAVLNDCKYGYDFLDGVLRLTLLRAPVVPDAHADIGRHEFRYALAVHDGPFAAGEIVRAGYELNVPPAVTTGRGAGGSLLTVSNPNVIVETVKAAEEGKGLVVRLYESVGSTAATRLTVPAGARRADACDMLENPRRKLRLAADGSVRLRFRPFEVKTICFR